ncbi:MAG: STM4012 family radical SAM protein [Thermoguttaceae bacterium]
MIIPLAERMQEDQFTGYAYAYPHKTSYRPLEPPVPLSLAWQAEEKDALFLYVHLPFCEVRCGFCNLFTAAQPGARLVSQTLDAIDRQSEVTAGEIGPRRISQVAFGGGTPSVLSVEELEHLFRRLSDTWPIDWNTAGVSFEVSPATVDSEKLSLLRARGVKRLSMGVQSFSPDDLKHLGRPQSDRQVEAAINAIRSARFPVFNLDLIYGVEGQTEQSWLHAIRRAVDAGPDELYLYPLYVREATGLGRTGKSPSARRRGLFLAARRVLLDSGYDQQSMRHFSRPGVASESDYCCQEDGMIGLGPGARSYTRPLHYSSEFAVSRAGVLRIIADFNAREAGRFASADYGVRLDAEEQRRRYLIKSLLRAPGLDLDAYQARFGAEAEDDFPQLAELADLDLGTREGRSLRLTPDGLSWSDVIGPWLYSRRVISRMEAFELA